MISLIDSLQARIPIIRLTANDPVNLPTMLQAMAATLFRSVQLLKTVDANTLNGESNTLYIIQTDDTPAVQWFNNLQATNSTLIILGDGERNPLVMDLGGYYPDAAQLTIGIQRGTGVPEAAAKSAVPSLRGLTVIQASSVVKVANVVSVQSGAPITHDMLAHLRAAIVGNVDGVTLLPKAQPFYQPDPKLYAWAVWAQKAYANHRMYKLRPRGILLSGKPGTGKTTAARYVAQIFNLPLVRLDIPAMLSRWQGEAEHSLRRALGAIEALSPCVVLVDEVEKVFSRHAADDTTRRLLSSMLWWLENHEHQILAVMTANDVSLLPPELIREGRLDESFEVSELNTVDELTQFVHGVTSLYPGMMDPSGIDFGSPPYNQSRVTRLIERAVVSK